MRELALNKTTYATEERYFNSEKDCAESNYYVNYYQSNEPRIEITEEQYNEFVTIKNEALNNGDIEDIFIGLSAETIDQYTEERKTVTITHRMKHKDKYFYIMDNDNRMLEHGRVESYFKELNNERVRIVSMWEERRINAERKAKELEEERQQRIIEKEKRERFFVDNADILKSNMTNFEKLTAYAELTKVMNIRNEDGRIISDTVINWIKERGYNKRDFWMKTHADRKTQGEYKELSKPIKQCFISNEPYALRISAQLYNVLSLEEIN